MKLPESEVLDIAAFEHMLNMRNLTNSYKLYWFDAVFEEIKKGNSEISFRSLFKTMISKCWHSIAFYRLNLGFMDKLHNLVTYIQARYQVERDISLKDLRAFLDELEDDEFDSYYRHFCRYVPYRLLSPFYPGIRVKDHLKNKAIEELSCSSPVALYRIYGDARKVVVNREWFDYIYRNQVIVNGWYYFKLISFLQQRNPNIPSIPFKLEVPRERNLGGARKFWHKVMRVQPIQDIYTGRLLEPKGFSIDHFIPWSFVLHDQLWNLVPTSKSVNSSK